MKKFVVLGFALIVIVAFFFIFAIYYIYNQAGIPPQTINNSAEKNYCTNEIRHEKYLCAEFYKPVCGWFNSTKIQCIRYPCAETYSNSCFACQDDKVDYWTEGECPVN